MNERDVEAHDKRKTRDNSSAMIDAVVNTRVLLCGPCSKNTVTGLTLAFDLVIVGIEKAEISHTVVDATFMGWAFSSGKFSFGRALETILVVLRVWWLLPRHEVYYATMSTSFVGFWRDYLTVAVASLLGKRVVLHLHGGGFEQFFRARNSWMQTRIVKTLEAVTNIIVLGELLKEQFRCVGPMVYDKLLVVSNGLTLGTSEQELKEKPLPDNQNPVNLLYLSSMITSKGFLDVIDAVSQLGDEIRHRPWHLHLCGDFVGVATEPDCPISDESSLRQYLHKLKLEKHVTYHGQVVGREKEQRFREAHIFLLPTYYPWEGQPLCIIEALAYAIPVVSTRHKGIPEEVIDNVNGMLVPPRQPSEIVVALEKLIESPEQYLEYSRNARIHYEKKFRRSVHLKRLLSVILGCEEAAVPSIAVD